MGVNSTILVLLQTVVTNKEDTMHYFKEIQTLSLSEADHRGSEEDIGVVMAVAELQEDLCHPQL